MSMKMGDLAKRKEPDAPAKNTTPLRQPVRPQGRPTRGKEKIKSRTMSLEDEYFELLEMMKFIPRFEKFTRSDVIRAAIFHLAEKTPQEIEDIVKLNEAITAADVTMRTDEIKRELMKKVKNHALARTLRQCITTVSALCRANTMFSPNHPNLHKRATVACWLLD